jgi:hypothetical protein
LPAKNDISNSKEDDGFEIITKKVEEKPIPIVQPPKRDATPPKKV